MCLFNIFAHCQIYEIANVSSVCDTNRCPTFSHFISGHAERIASPNVCPYTYSYDVFYVANWQTHLINIFKYSYKYLLDFRVFRLTSQSTDSKGFRGPHFLFQVAGHSVPLLFSISLPPPPLSLSYSFQCCYDYLFFAGADAAATTNTSSLRLFRSYRNARNVPDQHSVRHFASQRIESPPIGVQERQIFLLVFIFSHLRQANHYFVFLLLSCLCSVLVKTLPQGLCRRRRQNIAIEIVQTENMKIDRSHIIIVWLSDKCHLT